jgi:hypothetical protein
MWMQVSRYGAALAAAVALTVSGCGGGSDGDNNEGSPQTTADSGDSADTGGGTPGAVFANEDCRQLADAFDQGNLASSLTSGEDPTADLEATAAYLREAADEVPDEIADDVDVLADAYDDLAERAADVDWAGLKSGNPAAAASAAQLGTSFASADFAAAAQNLAGFVSENCTG